MDMRCGEADRWISLRVDGERIPSEEALRLDAHLDGCPACRRILADEARRVSLLEKFLRAEGEGEHRLAEAIIGAGCVPPRRWNRILASPILRTAASLAAALLVGIALRSLPLGPSGEPEAAGPERNVLSVLEHDSWKPDGVDYRCGEPLERGVRTQRWIYGFPGREQRGPRLYLEGERVDTLYRPVTWTYH